jgi:hypothetical protein
VIFVMTFSQHRLRPQSQNRIDSKKFQLIPVIPVLTILVVISGMDDDSVHLIIGPLKLAVFASISYPGCFVNVISWGDSRGVSVSMSEMNLRVNIFFQNIIGIDLLCIDHLTSE